MRNNKKPQEKTMTIEKKQIETTDINVISSCQSNYLNLESLMYSNKECCVEDDTCVAQTVNCLKTIVHSFFDCEENRKKLEKALINKLGKKEIKQGYIHADRLEDSIIQSINNIKLLVINESKQIQYEIM